MEESVLTSICLFSAASLIGVLPYLSHLMLAPCLRSQATLVTIMVNNRQVWIPHYNDCCYEMFTVKIGTIAKISQLSCSINIVTNQLQQINEINNYVWSHTHNNTWQIFPFPWQLVMVYGNTKSSNIDRINIWEVSVYLPCRSVLCLQQSEEGLHHLRQAN